MKSILILVIAPLLVTACAHDPKDDLPPWTQQPARTVDGGYIVYVEKGEAASQEAAQFKAEGLALEDLANECSFIPKGARIEDRASIPTKYGYQAIVKLGIEFEECQAASKTTDPNEIKKLANVPFTEQVKRYQDFAETGQMASQEQASQQLQPPAEVQPMPSQGTWDDRTHFYVVRQYVAYQNEVVILSPPQAYAPGSPQLVSYNNNVVAANSSLQTAAAKDPTLVRAAPAWSQIPNKPAVARPEALRASAPGRMGGEHALHAPPRPSQGAHPAGKRRGRGRKHSSESHEGH